MPPGLGLRVSDWVAQCEEQFSQSGHFSDKLLFREDFHNSLTFPWNSNSFLPRNCSQISSKEHPFILSLPLVPSAPLDGEWRRRPQEAQSLARKMNKERKFWAHKLDVTIGGRTGHGGEKVSPENPTSRSERKVNLDLPYSESIQTRWPTMSAKLDHSMPQLP